jgi:hypothetical protein
MSLPAWEGVVDPFHNLLSPLKSCCDQRLCSGLGLLSKNSVRRLEMTRHQHSGHSGQYAFATLVHVTMVHLRFLFVYAHRMLGKME